MGSFAALAEEMKEEFTEGRSCPSFMYTDDHVYRDSC
jgi:hypothetical protein